MIQTVKIFIFLSIYKNSPFRIPCAYRLRINVCLSIKLCCRAENQLESHDLRSLILLSFPNANSIHQDTSTRTCRCMHCSHRRINRSGTKNKLQRVQTEFHHKIELKLWLSLNGSNMTFGDSRPLPSTHSTRLVSAADRATRNYHHLFHSVHWPSSF